jgi:hypothetical protein
VRPSLEKPFTKIGLVRWLKVKALNSILSTEKKKKGAVPIHDFCQGQWEGAQVRETGKNLLILASLALEHRAVLTRVEV